MFKHYIPGEYHPDTGKFDLIDITSLEDAAGIPETPSVCLTVKEWRIVIVALKSAAAYRNKLKQEFADVANKVEVQTMRALEENREDSLL